MKKMEQNKPDAQISINDLDNLSREELLAYQKHIGQLLKAHYVKDIQAIDTQDVATVRKAFNLDENNDVPEEVWTYFWKDRSHVDIDGSNIDFFMLMLDLDGFSASEKKSNTLDHNYQDYSFTQSLILYSMFEEDRFEIFETLFAHPKTHAMLVKLIETREFFDVKNSYCPQIIDKLLENRLISLNQDFSVFDDPAAHNKIFRNQGLFSLWEAAVRKHQLDWQEDKLRNFVSQNWFRLDMTTLNVLRHEYFQDNLLSFAELKDLIGPDESNLGFLLAKKLNDVAGDNSSNSAVFKKKENVIENYGYLLNRSEPYVTWLFDLPHDNWTCLKKCIPTIIEGIACAYSNTFLDELPQTHRNVYRFLASIKKDNVELYEQIQQQTPDVMAKLIVKNPGNAGEYKLFLNEFGKLSLNLKLNLALDNPESDTQEAQISNSNNRFKI